jgi:hypothetical protein
LPVPDSIAYACGAWVFAGVLGGRAPGFRPELWRTRGVDGGLESYRFEQMSVVPVDRVVRSGRWR